MTNHAATSMRPINDILKPQPTPTIRPVDRLDDHNILIDELNLMYEANMTIGGQQNRFNASVIAAAIKVIGAKR